MGHENMVFLIPLSAIVLGIGSGIIKMLIQHQQRMAEIALQQRQIDPRLIDEMRGMRMELAELRDRVNQVAIDTDRSAEINRQYLQQNPPPPPAEALTQRTQV